MKKINRREYLRRMAAGTAGVVAARSGSLHSRAIESDRRGSAAESNLTVNDSAAAKPDWNWTQALPSDNPGIRLIFVGMMVFTYKGKDAEVVFHRGDPNHNLRIEGYEVGKTCTQIFKFGGSGTPVDIEEMDLRIKGATSNASFFRANASDIDRKYGHPRDFRWLLDLESDRIYKHKLHRDDTIYRTKLRVRNGTFFTYQTTNSQFKLEGGPQPGSVYHVAKVMAADIRLDESDRAVFKIDGTEIPHQLVGTSKYEVYFFNDCACRSSDCASCQTSDFPMVFDAVALTAAEPQFRLVLEMPGKEAQTTGLCLTIPEHIISIHNTDEAPCMGSGFGSGGGFP